MIPDRMEFQDTIRALDPASRTELHGLVRETAASLAASAGAEASVEIEVADG